MIGDLIAGAIGKRIDESDGKGGTLGAIVGVLGWRTIKRVAPVAIVVGAAYYAYRSLTADRNDPPTTA